MGLSDLSLSSMSVTSETLLMSLNLGKVQILFSYLRQLLSVLIRLMIVESLVTIRLTISGIGLS